MRKSAGSAVVTKWWISLGRIGFISGAYVETGFGLRLEDAWFEIAAREPHRLDQS